MTGKRRFCSSDCAACLTENPPTTAESVQTKVGGAETVPSKHGPDRDDDVEMVLEVVTQALRRPAKGKCSVAVPVARSTTK